MCIEILLCNTNGLGSLDIAGFLEHDFLLLQPSQKLIVADVIVGISVRKAVALETPVHYLSCNMSSAFA